MKVLTLDFNALLDRGGAMPDMHLLLVEDDHRDQAVLHSTVKVYKAQKQRDINVTTASSKDEAEKLLNNEIDAAIVDLKLGNDADAGGKLIEDIRKRWRIPVAVFTATPAHLDDRTGLVSVYKKGETEYAQVLDRLIQIYDTGLTQIFGGRGVIEREMDRVFWHAVLPSVSAWTRHRENGRDTEKALLRFTMGHLMEFLQEGVATFFDEEVYVKPPDMKATTPLSQQLRTGSIVRKSDGSGRFMVLSPACDLAVHKGQVKTDRILVACIEELDDFFVVRNARKAKAEPVPDDAEKAREIDEKKRRTDEALRRLCSNNYCSYLHILPAVDGFPGGLVNFRQLHVYKLKDFDQHFKYPEVQISPLFIKDIVSRFASYYARQGQPDLDFDRLSTTLCEQLNVRK